MTRFEKDYRDALENSEIEVLRERKAEIDKLEAQGRACKNGFRRQCIAQQLAKLVDEYNKIEALF